jgi:hypothetical protein
VPRIFVNGKYYTAAEFAGSNSRIFAVVDQLIDMARKEKAASASGAPAVAQK